MAGADVWGYRSTDGYVGSLRTTTASDGSFVLEEAEPGIAYRVRFGPPAGSGLVAEWAGDSLSRSSAQDIVLSAGLPVTEVFAELATGGSITGTVVDGSSAPLAGAIVRAYLPVDRLVATHLAVTDAAGNYRIDGVSPDASFRIRFAPPTGSGLSPEWFDDAATRSSAAQISVPAGEAVDLDAQLAPAP